MKKSAAYDNIFGSDIFNQLPIKSSEKEKSNFNQLRLGRVFSSDNIIEDKYNKTNGNFSSSIISNIGLNVNQTKKPQRSNYSKYLSEFHNINIYDIPKHSTYNRNVKTIYKNRPTSTKGTIKNELFQSQPFKYSSQLNRIESLKSNIFNDQSKETQNVNFNCNIVKIKHDDWSTNLDWRNSKSELIFMKKGNCTTIPNEDEDIYLNKNIINHDYEIKKANIDISRLEREFRKAGIHVYKYQAISDFLRAHQDPKIYFSVRDNEEKNLKEKINKISNDFFVQAENIGNSKINVDPKTYYSKRINKNNKWILNRYQKQSKIKNN